MPPATVLCRVDCNLPHALGMMSRNDVLLAAQQALTAESQITLFAYAEALSRTVSAQIHTLLPEPVFGSDCGRILARRFLEDGTAPLWSSVRQVVMILRKEKPRHVSFQLSEEAASFSIGAFCNGAHQGLCKATMTHKNVARLLNRLVSRVCSEHSWTTTTLLFNYATPPHIDIQNEAAPNLVLSLSVHDGGELWIEGEGSDFVEHGGVMVRGCKYSLHSHAIRFEAFRLLHMTCPWQTFDRVTLVAFTVKKAERLPQWTWELLLELGPRADTSPIRRLSARIRAQWHMESLYRSDGAEWAALSDARVPSHVHWHAQAML
ncbi:unnamed protein product, partial [Symbiodinium necroappetens]